MHDRMPAMKSTLSIKAVGDIRDSRTMDFLLINIKKIFIDYYYQEILLRYE